MNHNDAALCQALLEHRDLAEVESALINGANVNCKLEMREAGRLIERPLLLHAVHLMRSDVVTLLLHYGADINAQDSSGCTALVVATQRNNLGIMKTLLKHEAGVSVWNTVCSIFGVSNKVSEESKEQALFHAAARGNLEALTMLLSYGTDVNAVHPRTERTALHHAALSAPNYFEVKALLAYKKIRQECRDVSGNTAAELYAGRVASSDAPEESISLYVPDISPWSVRVDHGASRTRYG